MNVRNSLKVFTGTALLMFVSSCGAPGDSSGERNIATESTETSDGVSVESTVVDDTVDSTGANETNEGDAVVTEDTAGTNDVGETRQVGTDAEETSVKLY